MLKKKSVRLSIVGILATVVSLGFFFVLRGNSQVNSSNIQTAKIIRRQNQPNIPTARELDDAATPIVDLNSSSAGDENRNKKNQRHNHQGLTIEQVPVGNSEVILHSETSIPDFPIKISDLIVEGKVNGSDAFLSGDKSGIYSEYNISITDVIKNSPTDVVNKHDLITAERFGGRIRYPSGQIVRYRAEVQGSPTKNAKYLFFLKKVDADSYLILTAYEMRGNKVFALDGSRIAFSPKGKSAFDKHNDQDVVDFKKDLEKALKGGNDEKYNVF
jgi:hypothetical protein